MSIWSLNLRPVECSNLWLIICHTTLLLARTEMCSLKSIPITLQNILTQARDFNRAIFVCVVRSRALKRHYLPGLFLQEFGPDSKQSRCLRLLKLLRDIIFPDPEKEITDNENNSGFWCFDVDTAAYNLKDTGKLISSYVLKTLVLFEWQQNHADELWSGNNLSRRLLSILFSLVAH